MPTIITRGAGSAVGFGLFGTVAAVTDPYFNYNTLLLPGNGTNGAQNNTFLDSSTNNFTITRNGNTTQGTFSPFSQTGWSNYFQASNSDVISLGTVFLNSISSSTATFTMEAWVYLNSFGASATSFYNRTILAKGQIYLNFGIDQNGKIMLYHYDGSTRTNASTNAISLNTWTHVAAVVNGSGTITFYINGVANGTATWYGHSGTNQTARLGGTQDTNGGVNNYWNGYISNVRTTSTQVYTSSFTPPTAPLTAIPGTTFLSCQSNRFVDNSSNDYTLTVAAGTPSVQAFSPFNPTAAYSTTTVGGSGYFDGSGDYLQATLTGQSPGTGDLTFEFWVYRTNTQSCIISSTRSADTTDGLSIEISSNNQLVAGFSGDTFIVTSTGSVPLNAWTHCAIVRSSGYFQAYINGVAQISAVLRTTNFTSTTFNMGYWSVVAPYGTTYLTGYLSGYRYTKTAVYTSNFTPPTVPPTNIANTILLLNFTNAGIFDSTAKNDLETVGNAQISTSVSKFGGGSMYFDGTGDCLQSAASESLRLGSGDFTIECWVYLSVLDGNTTVMRLASGDATDGILFCHASNAVYATSNGSSWDIIGGSTFTGLTTNIWTHLALTRSGSTFRGFVNGTVVFTVTSSASIYQSSPVARIGAANSGGSIAMNGYIDDLRITKGIARYTGNFTPQTSQWQDQ